MCIFNIEYGNMHIHDHGLSSRPKCTKLSKIIMDGPTSTASHFKFEISYYHLLNNTSKKWDTHNNGCWRIWATYSGSWIIIIYWQNYLEVCKIYFDARGILTIIFQTTHSRSGLEVQLSLLDLANMLLGHGLSSYQWKVYARLS
jgi:hypothetical protein